MSSKFVYSETIPAEILPDIKAKLEKFESLVPGWAQEIRVYWNASSPANERVLSGEAGGDVAYRWGKVVICPGFLDEPSADRQDTAIHELVHVLISPLTNYYQQLLTLLDDQPDKVKEFMDNQFNERMEGVTVDITTALLRSIGEQKPDSPILQNNKLPNKKKRTRSKKHK